jgi:hypothetical protein
MSKPVHEFAEQADGTRMRTIEWSDGVKVSVQSHHRDADEEAAITASVIAGIEEALDGAEATITLLTKELEKTRALVRPKPKQPTRLLGTGYARFTTRGEVWLLGDREKGWAAFGYGFESWDALFRTFDVKITGHGVDEHGPWWSAENIQRETS